MYRSRRPAGGVAGVIGFLLRGCFVLTGALVMAEGAEPPRVLILFSNDRLLPANQRIDDGIRRALDPRGNQSGVTFFAEFLDAIRLGGPEREKAMEEYLAKRYREIPPNVLVALGPQALNFLLARRDVLFPGAPLVFGGVSLERREPGRDLSNVTGLPMELTVIPTVEALLAMRPETREILLVHGVSEFDRDWRDIALLQCATFREQVKVTDCPELPLELLKSRLGDLSQETAVIYLSYFQSPTGETYTPAHVAAEIAAASAVPVMGPYDTYLGSGILGVSVSPFEEEGIVIGNLIRRILAGEKPESIGILPPNPTRLILDERQVQRWGIKSVPAGAELRFHSPTLWEAHRSSVILGLCIFLAQGATIAGLLVHRARRRRAETVAREGEERMALAADAASLGMWVWDIPGDKFWMSDRGKRLFGYQSRDEVTYSMIRSRVHPEDRVIREEAIRQAVAGTGRYYPEYRLLLPDGSARWVASAGRIERDAAGKPLRLLGIVIDITERRNAEAAARDLGGRLINAQEDERRRIARELHDDLNQRLALLSVEMDILRTAGTESGESTASLDEMGEQLKELSSEVHKLAYQLHPAKLFQLGLVAAGRSYCRDLSRQSGLTIEFSVEEVPDELPPQLALCCYRILQESLGNVIRHSGANRVLVELSAAEQELRLMIRDTGKGFDVEAARRTGGLGMISMNERVRLLHGKFTIHSEPGQGARVEMRLPIPAPVGAEVEAPQQK